MNGVSKPPPAIRILRVPARPRDGSARDASDRDPAASGPSLIVDETSPREPRADDATNSLRFMCRAPSRGRGVELGLVARWVGPARRAKVRRGHPRRLYRGTAGHASGAGESAASPFPTTLPPNPRRPSLEPLAPSSP